MRLRNTDIKAIKEVTKLVFGDNAIIRVFGSRIDDKMRGGDIDLLIQLNSELSKAEKYQRKINFLVHLKKIIGDQKIDVLIDDGQQTNTIFQAAYKNGILL